MWTETNFSSELKFAGLLSNPYAEEAFYPEETLKVDPVKILDLLIANKILLTCYENISRFPSRYDQFKSLSILIKKTLDDKRRLMIDIDQKIMDLNELLSENQGIQYLLPKYTYFHREHNDIDVLVNPMDFKLTLELLNSHNYVPTSVQGPWKVTMAKWINGRRSAIHVHAKLHWHFEFIPTEELWKRSILIDFHDSIKLRVLCGEDAILVIIAHALFENRRILLSDLFQLTGVLRKFPDINWNQIFDRSHIHGWSSDLLFFLEFTNYLSFFLNSKILIPRDFFTYARENISPFDQNLRKLVTILTNKNFCNIPYVYSNLQSGITISKMTLRKPRFFSVSGFFDERIDNIAKWIKRK